MALTVTITSPPASATEAYTLTGVVAGVADPLDALAYRVNGDPEVDLPAAVGAFAVAVTVREGGNTIAVRAAKAPEEVTVAVPVEVPDLFRGLTTADAVVQLLPRSLREAL